MDDIYTIKGDYEESKRIIMILDREIERLKVKAKYGGQKSLEYYINNQRKLIENRRLRKEHQQNLKDIKEYNYQYNEIKKELNSQNSEIERLKKENEMLKQKKRSNTEKIYQKKELKVFQI